MRLLCGIREWAKPARVRRAARATCDVNAPRHSNATPRALARAPRRITARASAAADRRKVLCVDARPQAVGWVRLLCGIREWAKPARVRRAARNVRRQRAARANARPRACTCAAPHNGLRFSRRAERSGARSAGNACWAHTSHSVLSNDDH